MTRTLTGLLRHAARTTTRRPVAMSWRVPSTAPWPGRPLPKSIVLPHEAIDGAAILPLEAWALSSVAVFGTLADVRNLGDGGSSDVYAPTVVTPLRGWWRLCLRPR